MASLRMSPEANAAILEWLLANSKRPKVAVRLWAAVLADMAPDTGELGTCAALAAREGCSPEAVAVVLAELESIKALRLVRDAFGARYAVSPHWATYLPSFEARALARAAVEPLRV